MAVRILFAVALLSLCFTQVIASEMKERKILEALQLLGIDHHFSELHSTMVRGLNQRRLEGVASGAHDYDELEGFIDRYFAPQLLTRKLATQLVDSYDANRFELLISSLRSEQIQRVRTQVEQVAAAENMAALRAYAKEYPSAPLSRQKTYIIDGLDRASAGNELYAGVQALATLTMLRLQEVQQGVPAQFSEELLLQQLYTDYLESGRYTTEMIYRSALGDMSAEELQLSLRVYRSTVVQWFLGAAVEHFTTVAAAQREQLLKAVGKVEKPSAA